MVVFLPVRLQSCRSSDFSGSQHFQRSLWVFFAPDTPLTDRFSFRVFFSTAVFLPWAHMWIVKICFEHLYRLYRGLTDRKLPGLQKYGFFSLCDRSTCSLYNRYHTFRKNHLTRLSGFLQHTEAWHSTPYTPHPTPHKHPSGTGLIANQGSRAIIIQKTCRDSPSVVSKLIFTSKHSYNCSMFQDLQELLIFSPLQTQDS